MNKNELIELLEEIAEKDLSDGCDLKDHPCSVAVRAIEQCFSDILFLKAVANGNANRESKRAVVLLKLQYYPGW